MEEGYQSDYDIFDDPNYVDSPMDVDPVPESENAIPPSVQGLVDLLASSLAPASRDQDLHHLTTGLIALNLFDSHSQALISDFKEYLAVTKEINEAETELVKSLVDEIKEKYNETNTELLYCDAIVDNVALASGLVAVETSVAPKPKPPTPQVTPETGNNKSKKKGSGDKATKFGGKKANFNAAVTEKLLRWLASHRDNPTLTEGVVARLSAETHLTKTQIKSWMTNAKRRRQKEIQKWAIIIEKEKRGEMDEQGSEDISDTFEPTNRTPKQGLKRKVSATSSKKKKVKKEEVSDEDEDVSSLLEEESDSSSMRDLKSSSSDSDEPPKKKRKSPNK